MSSAGSECISRQPNELERGCTASLARADKPQHVFWAAATQDVLAVRVKILRSSASRVGPIFILENRYLYL